jgi:hypothetical protein
LFEAKVLLVVRELQAHRKKLPTKTLTSEPTWIGLVVLA